MGTAYFFRDDAFVQFDIETDKVVGKPLKLSAISGWPSELKRVDAAVNYGNGKVFLFSGADYIRWDILSNKIDQKARKWAKYWPGIPSSWTKIDAAVNQGDGKVFLFNGKSVVRYDIASDKVDLKKIPLPMFFGDSMQPKWTSFDAAVDWGNRRTYFFNGTRYVRFDQIKHKVDVKAEIATHWSGLLPKGWTGIDAAVTIDFDAERMAADLHKKLKKIAVGFGYAIYKGGRQQRSGSGGERMIASDALMKWFPSAQSFNLTTEMGIGSITKSLTAMAVVQRISELAGVTVDSKIGPWLPTAWKVHASVKEVTFAELLTHRSGFFINPKFNEPDAYRTIGSAETYASLKKAVASGITSEQRNIGLAADPGAFYNNTNFCLFRILLPRLHDFDGEEMGSYGGQTMIATIYSNLYKSLMERVVFSPSGVIGADCRVDVSDYPFVYPAVEAGVKTPPGTDWYSANDGDDTSLIAGAGGWKLNVVDLGRVINTWATTTRIMNASTRSKMVAADLGGYHWYGATFNHNGSAGDPDGYYNSYYWFADDVICVVMTNSRNAGLDAAINDAHKAYTS